MKIVFQALLMVAASVAVGACQQPMANSPVYGTGTNTSQPTSPGNSAQPLAVTPPNSPITVHQGQSFTIGLSGQGGAAGGYTWHLVASYNTAIVNNTDNRPGTLPANAQPGQFADTIYDFQGLQPGSTTLVFSEYRSWEGPTKAIATQSYPVTVQ